MKGKNKCKILKQIRQRIADENDIPYVTRACTYQGDCTGTCPKCEAELRYLEQELEKRRSLGKSVAVAAVAAGLSLSMAACGSRKGSGSAGNNDPSLPTPNPPLSTQDVLKGELPEETLMGLVAIDPVPSSTEPEELEGEPVELIGDVAYLPETESTDASPESTEAR